MADRERVAEIRLNDLVAVVDAPPEFANSRLNGSLAELTRLVPGYATVVLKDGPSAGQEWQLLPEHLRVTFADDRPRATCKGCFALGTACGDCPRCDEEPVAWDCEKCGPLTERCVADVEFCKAKPRGMRPPTDAERAYIIDWLNRRAQWYRMIEAGGGGKIEASTARSDAEAFETVANFVRDLTRPSPTEGAEVERLREALEGIANHEATSYDFHGTAQSDSQRQYQIGITDGHRLAAGIARRALNQEEGG